jgi:hypothetical protein
LIDFSATDTKDDGFFFTTNVKDEKNYMNNWWWKCASDGHCVEGGSDEGSDYVDSKELLSLDGSNDEMTSQRWMKYREFNEKHDIRIPIVLEKVLLFTDTCVFKMALKWYAVQSQFDFKFKHIDKMRVSAACKDIDC